jgi:predicted GIY-YIG superfamily endonuclease
MAFWTYMLRCSDERFYTGHTDDLEVRLAQHQQGYFRTCWTYTRRPVELVWCEAFPTREEALTAEYMVGGWSRAKKEALIRGDWGRVSFYARPPHERSQGGAHERPHNRPHERFSTSLETNGDEIGDSKTPFASSEVEKRGEGR